MEFVALCRCIPLLDIHSDSVLRHHPPRAAVHELHLLFLGLKPLPVFHESNRHAWYLDAVVPQLSQLLLELCCFLDRRILGASV